MEYIMDDFKQTRTYDFQSDVYFVEYVNNGTGCYHYDVIVSDDDIGIGFDTAEQLSENVLRSIARVAGHTAKLYRIYGYSAAQRDMRRALGII